jgi:serine/threonine-protein kinase
MADDLDPDATQPASPPTQPTAATSVGDGRYRMDAHIATGGMGAVWRAHDTVLERPVAVKLLRPELAGDRNFRARFESEARNAARVQHPGIAAVYDYGEDTAQRRSYLVMELVDGRPLDEIYSAGRLSRAALVGIVAQTADVLQAAHDQGLVHRDVKPANILVTPSGQVKVTDFGIAKALADASFTDTGIVLGTPHYLSPEQAAGKPASPASDVYALGVVLYEGLAGERPFVRDTPVATALAHLRDEPPALPADVPPWLATITMAALAKDPVERPASAAAMATALRAEDATGCRRHHRHRSDRRWCGCRLGGSDLRGRDPPYS